jgi:hypothetical protein
VAGGEDHYGVLVCGRDGAPFGRPEAEMLALLAERAASHIRHTREHDRVSRIVGDLQRALLAEPGRPHPNLDVAIRYQPVGQRSLVGGDWCETVRLHFGRTLLVVGDVMGHGVEAAVDMTAYRQSLRYIASADLPPHRVLRQLDDLVSGEPERRPASGSSGRPGVSGAYPASSNTEAHRSQLLGSSHRPCTKTTGVRPVALARSTCARSDAAVMAYAFL